ncbi:hypothetical protein GFS24_09220 [Chitinophaga sp. SYP-B3965]|uniref:hypothetical protein n=1 Tax=Chitinophaga sp. SYP-B3965 TaxID=2663120 RepID=UPI00129980E6|nr:hypothetical protein [Chitinophaga sp. SYP-B3965]MRG45295.1 hypothetical protein [Chitinophaga sp. SYP-B3965]
MLFLAQFLYGQNNDCVKRTNHSLATRVKNYPFNLAGQIQFVSFDGLVEITDKDEFAFSDMVPLTETIDTNVYSPAKEIKSLTRLQIDKLTDVLYNYGFRGRVHSQKTRSCYDPRNAILFYDNAGKPLAFIEICFECLQTRESNEKISLGQMCDQKLDMLKDLFRKAGIEYGVN